VWFALKLEEEEEDDDDDDDDGGFPVALPHFYQTILRRIL
jgi:hypothetical protein